MKTIDVLNSNAAPLFPISTFEKQVPCLFSPFPKDTAKMHGPPSPALHVGHKYP